MDRLLLPSLARRTALSGALLSGSVLSLALLSVALPGASVRAQTGAAPAHINSWLDICTLTLEGLLSHQFEPARARQALTLLLAAMQPAEQVPA